MHFLKKNTGILIRFDDIAANMNWELMDKCEELFNNYNIKPVVGVIPNNKDIALLSFPERKNFWEIVNNWQSKKWQVAMHGYTHLYDRDTYKKDFFNYGGKSEFFGHPIDNQVSKIKKGQAASIKISDNFYKGKVNYVSRTSDRLTRNFKVQIELSNQNNNIISGLSSEIQIGEKSDSAYFIPSSLISLDNQGILGIKVILNKKVSFLPLKL